MSRRSDIVRNRFSSSATARYRSSAETVILCDIGEYAVVGSDEPIVVCTIPVEVEKDFRRIFLSATLTGIVDYNNPGS